MTSNAPAILFIHGFPLGRPLWQFQESAFPPSRVLVPELPGFGKGKPAPSVADISSYSWDMIAEMDAAGIDRAVVCGLSMGGYIALDIFRRFPNRVLALGLISTRAEADTTDGKRARDEAIARVTQHGLSGLAEEMVPKLVAVGADRGVVDTTKKMILNSSQHGVTAALAAMRDRVDSRPLLPQINVPTFVVAGADDRLIPVSSSQLIAAAVPGATLTIIPGSGHLVPLERPVEFNGEVRRFLATLA